MCLHHKYWTWFCDKIFLKYHNMAASLTSGRQPRRELESSPGKSVLVKHALYGWACWRASIPTCSRKPRTANQTTESLKEMLHISFVVVKFFSSYHIFCMFFSSFLTPLQLPTPNNKTKKKMPKQSKMKQTVHRNTAEFVWCWPATPGCGACLECVDTTQWDSTGQNWVFSWNSTPF